MLFWGAASGTTQFQKQTEGGHCIDPALQGRNLSTNSYILEYEGNWNWQHAVNLPFQQ